MPKESGKSKQPPRDMPPEAWDMCEAGLIDEQEGRLADAETKYGKAVQIHPVFEEGWLNLALVQQDQGDLLKAIVTSKSALEYLPNSSQIWCNLGTFYLQIARMEEKAEHAFRKALECDPDFILAMVNLGMLLAKQGDVDGAEMYLTRSRVTSYEREDVSESKEFASRVWAEIAVLRAVLGNTDGVESACTAALEIDDSSPVVQERIALARSIISDKEK
ncbi:MAG: tetratricopeptide repeat protein [Candidatus Thorarchaeota archaeon]|jgi:Flp pilus assembly protein TadD